MLNVNHLPYPMNNKYFAGWANSHIVCPRGTRYHDPRGLESVPTLLMA